MKILAIEQYLVTEQKVFIGENNNFTPLASLHIAGNLWVSGSDAQGGAHVTASGNIS